MKKRIIRMSEFVKEVLGQGKPGYVHSVYRKTINLCFNGQLIAIQLNGSPMSPLSIIIDAGECDFSTGRILVGESAERTSQGIVIDGMEIYEENTEIVDLKLNSLRIRQAREFYINGKLLLYKGIMELLKEKKVLDLFFCNSKAVCRTPIALYAEIIIHEFLEALKKEEYDKAAQKIIQIVGLGKGLTPSGDDFLCGVLAGLTCFSGGPGEVQLLHNIRKYAAAAVKETNDISGAFLKCAVNGYYNEAIIKLPMQVNSMRVAELFSGIGHSSGADTLCGIYFIVETMLLLNKWK